MKKKINAAVGPKHALLWGIVVTVLCLAKIASGQALPEGQGKAEFVHNCTACHRASMVIRVKKTPGEWRKSVDEMAARGTDGSKEDLDNVYLYLVRNYAKDSSDPAPASPPSQHATVAQKPCLNPSIPEHLKQIIAQAVAQLTPKRLTASVH